MTKKSTKLNLVWFGKNELLPVWALGEVFQIDPLPKSVYRFVEENLSSFSADAWLFWDSSLGVPNGNFIQNLLLSQDDVWHAGLRMGMSGQPESINFVSPTWMLNRDPNPEIDATSWRMSLRCCLIRTEVLQQMGGPLAIFASLDGASLEMGIRYIKNGVFMRYVPELIPFDTIAAPIRIPLEDQLSFIKTHFGYKWMQWAVFRSLVSRDSPLKHLLKAKHKTKSIKTQTNVDVYQHKFKEPIQLNGEERVSVLIPTINRYPYLRVILDQFRRQTFPPYEIIVIDQTPEPFRDDNIVNEFPDLPLRWFTLEKAGQCSARNFGLNHSKGDFVLFVDDDDEIPENLIETHLTYIKRDRNSVSNGVANEVGSGPLPINFAIQRISDVFPTNNTLIKKDILQKSGLFDLAYDRGQVEDADLGMRIYLSGERMILNPEIAVLHHHAPQGGLRTHKARVNTFAASRKKITLRVLPSVSDLYLSHRYFTDRQVREMLWISVLGTFSLYGPWWKKLLKVILSFFALPNTLWQIHARNRTAGKMLLTFPQIPSLEDQDG